MPRNVRMASPARLRAGLSAAARGARHRIGEDILRESQARAPVDPSHDDKRGPHLRDSGFVDSDEDLTRVGYSQFYGRFVEMGTQNMAAQPFLRPAALKVRRNIS